MTRERNTCAINNKSLKYKYHVFIFSVLSAKMFHQVLTVQTIKINIVFF